MKLSKRFTWKSNEGRIKNQIDHIIINRRWRSSISNVKTTSNLLWHSDHRLLVVEVKLKLKRHPKLERPKRFSTEEPRTSETRNDLQDKLLCLLRDESLRAVEEAWSRIKSYALGAAESTIETTERKRKKWISADTYKLIDQRKKGKVNSSLKKEIKKAL